MSLDGIMLSAIKEDLINNLIDGRIDKIYQNNNNTITMIVRNNNYNYKLLLSSHPQFARLHITEKNYDNPVKPPDFCMLLRKYITRGTIVSIEQPDFERIITLNINAYNKSYYLIIEVMGKYSNIILVDSNGIVLDSIKRITSVMSSERELYPGIKYKYPPKQDKSNPLYISEDEFIDKIGDFTQASYKAIMYNFRGIGPYSAREIVYRANIAPTTNYNLLNTAERNDLWKSYSNIINKTKEGNLEATAGIENDKVKYLSAFPLLHLEDEYDYKIFDDTGKLLDFYFTKNISGKEIKSIKKQLNDIADNYLGKNLKKQKKFRQKYKEGKNAKQFKKKGELITANIYQIKRGMKEIEVVDYYDEEQKNIKINLDPKLSPSENAQKY
ncbi:MAG: Rqc2 family fibronectin-binding protein, partial [Bacillota bacterium]